MLCDTIKTLGMRSRVFSANQKTELKPIGQSETAWHRWQGCCWVYLHHPGSNYLYTLHTPHSSQLWLTYKATINMSRPEPSLATEYTTKGAHNWTSIILLLCKLKTLRNIALANCLDNGSWHFSQQPVPIQWSIERRVWRVRADWSLAGVLTAECGADPLSRGLLSWL